jgi:DtxR family Mn-dependent transcriptional regulator
MNIYNPITALIIFFVIAIVLFFFFRPTKGWYWIIKKNIRSSEKVIIEDILKQL